MFCNGQQSRVKAGDVFTRHSATLFGNSHIGINFYFSFVLSIPLFESAARQRLITPCCTVFKKGRASTPNELVDHPSDSNAALSRPRTRCAEAIADARVHFNSKTNPIDDPHNTWFFENSSTRVILSAPFSSFC